MEDMKDAQGSEAETMDFTLDEDLIAIFKNEATEILSIIRTETDRLNKLGVVTYDMMRAFHTIGSTSGTMGFPGLSELSYAIERWSISHVNRHEPINKKHLELINKSSLIAQQMIESIFAGNDPGEAKSLVSDLYEIAVDVGHSSLEIDDSDVEMPEDGLISDSTNILTGLHLNTKLRLNYHLLQKATNEEAIAHFIQVGQLKAGWDKPIHLSMATLIAEVLVLLRDCDGKIIYDSTFLMACQMQKMVDLGQDKSLPRRIGRQASAFLSLIDGYDNRQKKSQSITFIQAYDELVGEFISGFLIESPQEKYAIESDVEITEVEFSSDLMDFSLMDVELEEVNIGEDAIFDLDNDEDDTQDHDPVEEVVTSNQEIAFDTSGEMDFSNMDEVVDKDPLAGIVIKTMAESIAATTTVASDDLMSFDGMDFSDMEEVIEDDPFIKAQALAVSVKKSPEKRLNEDLIFDSMPESGSMFDFVSTETDEEEMSFGEELPVLGIESADEVSDEFAFAYDDNEDSEQEAILAALIAEQEAVDQAKLNALKSNESDGSNKSAAIIAVVNVVDETAPLLTLDDAKQDKDAIFKDDIDPDLVSIFYEECPGLMDEMRVSIREYAIDQKNIESLRALKRALHTIKGGSRMCGVLNAGSLFHVTETMIDDALATNTMSSTIFDKIRDKIGKGSLLLADSFSQYIGQSSTIDLSGLVRGAQSTNRDGSVKTRSSTGMLAKASSGGTVKIGQKMLDDVLMISGETSIIRSQIHSVIHEIVVNTPQLKTSLERLRKLIRDIELQGEIMISSGGKKAKEAVEEKSEDVYADFELDLTMSVEDAEAAEAAAEKLDQVNPTDYNFDEVEEVVEEETFDPLQMDRFTKLQEIMRMASEAINDVEAMNLTLHSGAKDATSLLEKHEIMSADVHDMMAQAQLVPIDSMVGRFRKTMNQACREVGKQARLEISGNGKMDRLALEKASGAIDHILRNAVAHGVESPEARIAAGKLEEGVIRIISRMEGDEAVIEMIDDGGGILLSRVRSKAESNGLIKSDNVLTDNEVINLIFAPGFSTADVVSEISGRGVGLDAVKKDIEGMGGTVRVESEEGVGSTFFIRVRSTIATIHVLPMRVNNFWYAIPASNISRVAAGRISADKMSVKIDNEDYALTSVAGGAADVADGLDVINCILMKESNVAVYIENIFQGRELVMKKLGRQAASLPGVIGASVMDDGNTALIVNPAKIVSINSARKSKEITRQVDVRKRVLVVDDSLTVRKVSTRFLEREGFVVEAAIDGEDAMEKIIGFNPDVVLSDIEMPRMDGFEFVKAIRAESSHIRSVPIIMISSRAIDKHIEFALSIGASAYFGKPYKEQELLAKINELLKVSTREAA